MPNEPFENVEIKEENGVLSGPFRKPFNEHLQAVTSIHHDETAQKVGMRGGTIAGSYHMEQFVPLFMRVFGREWFETGNISLYFKYASTHLEPVQCFIRQPDSRENAQTEIWMNHDNGMVVAEGTASVGNPTKPSALRKRVNNPYPPGETRIYKDLSVGMEIPPVSVKLEADRNRDRFERMTEPLDWYINDSPWGGPILTAPQMIEALRKGMVLQEEERYRKGEVGLFGALEFSYKNGPVFTDKEYMNTGKILVVGETPKTEYYWHEGRLEDPNSGKIVAESLIMIRVMKTSSSLYPELQA